MGSGRPTKLNAHVRCKVAVQTSKADILESGDLAGTIKRP